MDELLALREKRAKLYLQAELYEIYHTDKNGRMSAADKDAYDGMIHRINELTSTIEFLERIGDPNIASHLPYGWICPKCGAVLAPTECCCMFCTTANIRITT